MRLSIYDLKKWYKMFSGKSLLHVNQKTGKIFSKSEVKGYYNDLTEKVLRDPDHDEVKLPTYEIENKEKIFFSIMIFQFGLGSYDLFLINEEKLYFDKFMLCVEWAVNNQNDLGAWDTFSFKYPDAPYSSMAQGEGASLLVRAYEVTHDVKYLLAAERALNFMLVDVNDGGTAEYTDDNLFLLEGTAMPVILNGWIFSIFGLYDYLLVSENTLFREAYNKTINSLEKNISKFDISFWSLYDIEKNIASPFYHELHIYLLRSLYDLTDIKIFLTESYKYEKYFNNGINKYRAILIKALQKIS